MLRRFLGTLIISASLAHACMVQPSYGQNPQADFMKSVREKISQGNLDEATEEVLDASKEGTLPFSLVMNSAMTISMGRIAANEKEKATELIDSLLQPRAEKADSKSLMELTSSLQMADMVFKRAGADEKGEKWVDQTLNQISSKLADGKYDPLYSGRSMLVRLKANQLNSKNKHEEGRALVEADVALAKKMLEADPDNEQAEAHVVTTLTNLLTIQPEENAMAAVYGEIEKFASDRLGKNPGRLALFSNYFTATMTYASSVARTTPDAVEPVLAKLREQLGATKEALPESAQQLTQMGKSIEGIERQIASARKLLELVGKVAPPMDPMEWANGNKLEPSDLNGKVVLLDFWAVWCGPCIATFPHLKHLEAEYGSKGLQIVGVTRQYQYEWNDDAKKASRAEHEVSLEDELTMLNAFMQHHELKHPSMVTPKESTMNQDYGVTGIPHVVVIDRKGIVRLIRVGSGEKNAQDIEKMIQTLLDEPA